MKRLLLLSALLLAGCGGNTVAQRPAPSLRASDLDPASARVQEALRLVRQDFVARSTPNPWGVGANEIRIRGYTLEAWSTLPQTRAGMRRALALCTRLYRRYVINPSARYGVGQAAVYSRASVLLTASLRYKGRCYRMVDVS